MTKILLSGKLQEPCVNEEAGESKHIKMKPSIVRKGCFDPINWGKTLGRWLEDAIEEKIEREERVQKVK